MADDAVGPPGGGGDPVGAGDTVPPEVTPGAGAGTPTPGPGAPVGRRLFLGLLGAGAAGIALSRWQYMGDDAHSGADVAQSVPLSAADASQPPDRETVEGQHPNVSVADGRFRYYSVGDIPDGDPSRWRVRVDGQGVDAPVTMDLATLKAFPNVAFRATFRCVTGWRVRDCVWRGVRLRDVIAASRPNAKARFVTLYAGDGVYTDSLAIDQARNDHCILAWELGGQPLIREQGAPLRLVFPDMYGYKNVKWLNRIEVKPSRDIGFWEQQGWEMDAWVYNPDQVQAG